MPHSRLALLIRTMCSHTQIRSFITDTLGSIVEFSMDNFWLQPGKGAKDKQNLRYQKNEYEPKLSANKFGSKLEQAFCFESNGIALGLNVNTVQWTAILFRRGQVVGIKFGGLFLGSKLEPLRWTCHLSGCLRETVCRESQFWFKTLRLDLKAPEFLGLPNKRRTALRNQTRKKIPVWECNF